VHGKGKDEEVADDGTIKTNVLPAPAFSK